MSNENKKSELIEKWNYYKDIPARYNGDDDKFRDLLKDAYKLVDTSDLDKKLEDYDFSREGDESYHKIMGKKFKGFSEYNKDYEEYPTSFLWRIWLWSVRNGKNGLRSSGVVAILN